MRCYAIPVSQDPDPESSTEGGDESLADAFWSVARQLRETSQETLAPWDITPAHLRALRVLRRHGTMRLSELSDRLHIAPRSATEGGDALETRRPARRRGAGGRPGRGPRDRGEPGLRPAQPRRPG